MPHPSPLTTNDTEPHEPARFANLLLMGVRIAWIVGTLAGLAESILIVGRVAANFDALDPLPASFALGAAGRILLTHSIFWLVAGLIVSLPLAAWLARRDRTVPLRTPETPFVLVFLLAASVVVIPPALELAHRLDAIYGVLASGVVALLAAAVFLLLLWASNRSWFGKVRFALKWLPAGCLILALASALLMVRSPFCGADTFRLATAQRATDAPPADRSPDPPFPDILWIVMDTVRADHLSCYGYDKPTTPALDAWAESSTLFERAVSSSFWTVPSHASMFTGLPVRQHGATHENAWLAEDHHTIAELLADRGYRTAMFSNNPHLSVGRNFHQGFQHKPPMYEFAWFDRMSLAMWQRWLGLAPPLPWMERDQGAAATNAFIARFADQLAPPPTGQRPPWFVLINYMDAHLPYSAPARFRKLFVSPSDVRRSYALHHRAYGDIMNWLTLRFNMLGPDRVAPRDRQILADLYDASLAYLDMRIAELLGAFQHRALLDNALVIITSDHGESLGQHDQWGHPYGVHDTLTRVPLILRNPGQTAGQRIQYPVQLADLFPTVAAIAGQPANPPTIHHGLDLNNIDTVAIQERAVVSESLVPDLLPILWGRATDPNFQAGRWQRRLRAVTNDGYKYVHASDGKHELYHLAEDPGELHNLIDAEPGIAGRLRAKLRTWERDLPEYVVPPDLRKPDLPARMLNNLRALGYLQ